MSLLEAEPPRALFAEASRRWVRFLPWVTALLLCVALLPTTIGVLVDGYGLHVGVAGLLAIAQTAPLLLAVTRPLLAWCILFTADIAGALALLTVDLDGQVLWPFPPMEIVGYIALCMALGLREPRRRLVLVWLATAAMNTGLMFIAPHDLGSNGLLLTILGGVTIVLSAALRERYDAQRKLVEQETISHAERDRRTLLEERARIARELHDVVAHHMSVITVQADTAAFRLDELPSEVQEEFSSIATTARSSLAEMRRLLGVLRDEEEQGELTPQPGLSEISHLVQATVRAGTRVDFASDSPEVPDAVGLTAYRIIQEALANIVRHAPDATAQVSVSDEGDRHLTVRVTNASPPEASSTPLESAGTGHGLVGMRERVRLAGGTLDVGSLPDGGFRVLARLPMTTEEST